MNPAIQLVFFSGCPHVPMVKNLLAKYGLEFLEICQNVLASDSSYQSYSSPTVLIDNKIIIGGQIATGGSACSLMNPAKAEELLQLALASRDLRPGV